MLARVVSGSRTWMCTMAAPALAASIDDCAICCGVTGTAGFFPGVSADPVTAHEIITLRCIVAPLAVDDRRLAIIRAGRAYQVAIISFVNSMSARGTKHHHM